MSIGAEYGYGVGIKDGYGNRMGMGAEYGYGIGFGFGYEYKMSIRAGYGYGNRHWSCMSTE